MLVSSDFEYQDEEYHTLHLGYNPDNAKKWDDIVKCMKEAYPRAKLSDLFNVCVAIRELKTGNRITLGAGADGAIAMTPREGVAGPDLRKIHCSGRRTVFHACFMSDAVDILVNGPRGRLTERDAARQKKFKPEKVPKPCIYVSKSKDCAAGYPQPQSWSKDLKTKIGEKVAEDDSPPLWCVLEGEHALWDRNGVSTRLWETNYKGNQQWAIAPESVVFQAVHIYTAAESVVERQIKRTLQEGMQWDDGEFGRRQRRAEGCVGTGDLGTIQFPKEPAAFAPKARIPWHRKKKFEGERP